ncbi:heat shock transcription factor 2, partial [Pseudovirgaria hyperparasitica]
RMLENQTDEAVVRWGNEGDSFVVLENEKFTKHILPKHFKHSNFASFVRQLNKYDFHKVRHNNEENGQSPYGAGAWEFKHPDFKMNNKDALDNIRRKAPAPRKPNANPEDMLIPTQQMDLVNTQLVATQQQLQQMQGQYEELRIHHSMLLQELIGLQKTVVNHEHVMQNVMVFLNSVDAQRRRDSRVGNPFAQSGTMQNGAMGQQPQPQDPLEEDMPASPLQHASKLLSETNADAMLNPRNLEHMNEISMRMNGTLTTPPPDYLRNGRPSSRGGPPNSASSTSSTRNDIDHLVYPVGASNGIDPMFGDHIHNIPYPMPAKAPEQAAAPQVAQASDMRKKSTHIDPGWVRPPQILLVEDDPTCRRIGGKFLHAFQCNIDCALDGLEAVNKMNSGQKYDLILMDIIMPNLDGVSACHLIRQFDPTPIVAMTSNIRSDDISMYFQHGMNDVLPKPFTKEGLLGILEKHLAHLKKSANMDPIGHPIQALAHTSARQSLKEEESPSKSPATVSNWNSPNQLTGVSPVGSSVQEDYANVQGLPGPYGAMYGNASQLPMGGQRGPPMGQQQPNQSHRRQISDISGGPDMNDAKRQQIITQDEGAEDPLQALILADPFETRFSPFTLERPRCLLPLANTPLIEYTFEFLANAGVEEVYVYCGAHTDQLEEYVKKSKWVSRTSPFRNVEILRSASSSIGDAMRDLDNRAILNGDFLVVYGDVVSNLPLETALAQHRARRAKDRNAIMTMVLREAGNKHRTKAQGTSPIFVIDPRKERCLHFEQMPNREQKSAVSIDEWLLSDHQELEIRQDLIDCGIDICTPDVLALWSDNFDFQAPRKGFLHSVLKDYELNGKTTHTHIVSKNYAARVRNLHTYDSISKDIVSRWAYPLCPDTNLVGGQSYTLQWGNIYLEKNIILARSCKIDKNTVIGRGSSIAEGSVISNSIIGRDVQIGKNVVIDGAYIWNSATVSDGSVVKKAILADEVVIGRKCVVEPGALISYGVRIADGVKVKGTSRLTRAKRRRKEGEDIEKGHADAAVVGEGGDGFELIDEDEDEEEEVVPGLISHERVYNMSSLSLSTASISTLNSDDDDDVDLALDHDHDHITGPSRSRSAGSSFLSVGSLDSQSSQHAANFDHDATSSILDSLERGHESANINLELTALRMTTNASEHQVRRAVATAFAKRVAQLVSGPNTTTSTSTSTTNTTTTTTTPPSSVKDAVDAVFGTQKQVLARTMFDRGQTDRPDQVDFLLLLQADLVHRDQGEAILVRAATKLVEMDVVEPEGVEQWWEDARAVASEGLVRVRAKTGALVEFLREESSEGEESGSEDEGEGEGGSEGDE